MSSSSSSVHSTSTNSGQRRVIIGGHHRAAPRHSAPTRRTKRRAGQVKITFGPSDHVHVNGPPPPALEQDETKTQSNIHSDHAPLTRRGKKRARNSIETTSDVGNSNKKRKVNGHHTEETVADGMQEESDNHKSTNTNTSDTLPDGMAEAMAEAMTKAMAGVWQPFWRKDRAQMNEALTKAQNENEAYKETVKELKMDIVKQLEQNQEVTKKCKQFETEKDKANQVVIGLKGNVCSLEKENALMKDKMNAQKTESDLEILQLKAIRTSLQNEMNEHQKALQDREERLKEREMSTQSKCKDQIDQLKQSNQELKKQVETHEASHAKYLQLVQLSKDINQQMSTQQHVSAFEKEGCVEDAKINAESARKLKEMDDQKEELVNMVKKWRGMEDKYHQNKKLLKLKRDECKRLKKERDELARDLLANDKKATEHKSQLAQMEMKHKLEMIEKEKEMHAFKDRELRNKQEIDKLQECVIIGESKGFRMKYEGMDDDDEDSDVSDDEASVESDKSNE